MDAVDHVGPCQAAYGFEATGRFAAFVAIDIRVEGAGFRAFRVPRDGDGQGRRLPAIREGFRMKRVWVVGCSVALWGVFSSTSFANIRYSHHDFSQRGWSGGEICIV